MGTSFTLTYANLAMDIKIYSIIRESYAIASICFENPWLRFLGECQILLKVNLIKPNHLLSFLLIYQSNNNIQFATEKNQTRLPYLDILLNKRGTKIYTDISHLNMSHLRKTTHGIV